MQKIPRAVFTNEFKEEAVEMVIDGGLSQSDVCRRLSLGSSTLARWARQARKGILPATAERNTVTEE